MPDEERRTILAVLDAHSRSGSNAYLDDSEIASKTGLAVGEVCRELDILESEGKIRTANTMGSQSAVISPEGMRWLEGH